MSQDTYTAPLPAIDRQAPFAVQAAPVLERMRAFLGSRAKSCALPVNTEATRSPLELTPSAEDGTQEHKTFTRNEVVAIAREVVAIMSEKPLTCRRPRFRALVLGGQSSEGERPCESP